MLPQLSVSVYEISLSPLTNEAVGWKTCHEQSSDQTCADLRRVWNRYKCHLMVSLTEDQECVLIHELAD